MYQYSLWAINIMIGQKYHSWIQIWSISYLVLNLNDKNYHAIEMLAVVVVVFVVAVVAAAAALAAKLDAM